MEAEEWTRSVKEVFTVPRSGLNRLGLPSTATAQEVRARYREKARALHPDAGGSGDGRKMRKLQDAYQDALTEVGASERSHDG